MDDARSPDRPRRPGRRRNGDRAEAFVAEGLVAAGWRILGRQVPVGRDELDLVAVEPGDPPTLVFLEVRSSRDGRFGAPEESVVGRKAARTYRAALAVVRAGVLPDGRLLPHLAWRVDVVGVMGLAAASDPTAPGRREPAAVRVRHLRGVDLG